MDKQWEVIINIKIRLLKYLGHIVGGQRYKMLRLIIQDKIREERSIGRKRISRLWNLSSQKLFRVMANKTQKRTVCCWSDFSVCEKYGMHSHILLTSTRVLITLFKEYFTHDKVLQKITIVLNKLFLLLFRSDRTHLHIYDHNDHKYNQNHVFEDGEARILSTVEELKQKVTKSEKWVKKWAWTILKSDKEKNVVMFLVWKLLKGKPLQFLLKSN